MDNLEIKRVSEKDIPQLQRIGRQTFSETFAHQNDPEDMRKYLDDSFHADRLKSELQNPDSELYFASADNKVIGYLKVNSGQAQTELRDHSSVEIERIYVLKEYHGMKVGQILYEKALEIAKQKKADYVWLGVWEKNQRAISFYKKNGFVESGKHVFKLGNDEQTDILMRLTLT